MKAITKFVVVDDYELQAHFEDGRVTTIAYADNDLNLFSQIVNAAGRDLRIPVSYEDV